MTNPILPEPDSGTVYPGYSSNLEGTSGISGKEGVQEVVPLEAPQITRDTLAAKSRSDIQKLSIEDTSLKPEAPAIPKPRNSEELPSARRTEESQSADISANPYFKNINLMGVLRVIMLEKAKTENETRALSTETAIELSLFSLDSGIKAGELAREITEQEAMKMYTQSITSAVNSVSGASNVMSNVRSLGASEVAANQSYRPAMDANQAQMDAITQRGRGGINVGDQLNQNLPQNNTDPAAPINRGLKPEDFDLPDATKDELRPLRKTEAELEEKKQHMISTESQRRVQENGIFYGAISSGIDAASKCIQAGQEMDKAELELLRASEDAYKQAEESMKNTAEKASDDAGSRSRSTFDALSKMTSDFQQAYKIGH